MKVRLEDLENLKGFQTNDCFLKILQIMTYEKAKEIGLKTGDVLTVGLINSDQKITPTRRKDGHSVYVGDYM